MPFAQSLDQIIVSWNRFLRGFGLANANNVLHDRACYMNLFRLEVHVSPFQREQLAPPQAGGYGHQGQGLFSKAQICEQFLDFIAGQDIWRRAAFGALAIGSKTSAMIRLLQPERPTTYTRPSAGQSTFPSSRRTPSSLNMRCVDYGRQALAAGNAAISQPT